jgi:ABC-type multidrug transport system fused ATPase/permease subunit
MVKVSPKRIFSSLPWARRSTLATLFALIAAAALPLAVPYILKLFIDVAIPARDTTLLWTLGAAGVGLYGASSLARYVGRQAVAQLAEDVRFELRQRAFGHLQGLSLSYHRSRSIGDLVARVQYDTHAIKNFVGATVPAVVELVVTVGGTAVILLVLEPRLTLLAFAALPVAVVIAWLFRDKIRPLSHKISEHHGEVYSTVHEALTCVEEIKVYDGAHEFEGRLAEQGGGLRDAAVELARHRNKLFPLLNFGISLVLLGVLVAGCYMAIAGAVTVGTIVAYYYYISKSLGPIRSASSLVLGWHRASAAVERLEELLEADDVLPEADEPEAIARERVELAFEGVSFDYRDHNTGELFRALDGVDLQVGQGARVALLGPSGSGKSTTGKLVPRLFDPAEGQITASGVPLARLDLDAWRQSVGYVGQDVFLFVGTIEENIRFGAVGELSDEAFERAVRVARVDEVVAGKDDGLATQVGEGGVKLSGGQKKRVALARALVRQPAILVIDQLAADLQEDLCREIFEMIRREYDVSILYLGHRIPAGFEPDAVHWMEDGRIKRRLHPQPDDDRAPDAPKMETGT